MGGSAVRRDDGGNRRTSMGLSRWRNQRISIEANLSESSLGAMGASSASEANLSERALVVSGDLTEGPVETW